MKYLLSSFSILFTLFFAIPFPMLLYYNVKNEDPPDLAGANPWIALGLVVLSIGLWLFLLTGYFRHWILSAFSAKRNMELLKKDGVPREAEILSSTKIHNKSAEYDIYELKLSFKNLVNTEIIQNAAVNDVRPAEHRFEVGKKVDLLIDSQMKRIPYFMFAGSEASIRAGIMLLNIAGWLLCVVLVVGYYLFSYQQESDGAGWRFVIFGHPLFVCPLVLLFYRFLGLFIENFTGSASDQALIKFKGIRTTAKVLHVEETGTYINEQPMMRFELEYIDEQHQAHRTTFKKLIGVLSLDMIKQKNIDIFYLKDDPTRIAFAEDLDNIN
ncbi:hypothetical protein SAMN05428988_5618 [Chitinophaga sp. YR573]|uniref:hypothetical protein n=1 Tax=Chitinophaga sp. YR573 TaxID=1881040 RepID=UPI0008C4C2B7|nr:hypothetical protein [Chitinophaga sp. YR573]SEW43732.1 hypothetical protein SAMN05428988_5618 [Chitinophaga sp. YR573]